MKNYLIENDRCVFKNLENCELVGFEMCLVCADGHYMQDKKCIAVPEPKLISGCAKYDLQKEIYSCLGCEVGKMLSAETAECIKIELIEGC